MATNLVFKGDVIFTPTPQGFQTLPNGHVVVAGGCVEGLYSELPPQFSHLPLHDFSGHLILPGFVDLHVHAPQFFQTGVGLDDELIPWLDRHTYPLEGRFADREFARAAYGLFVDELIRVGTLRASIFATVHKESTAILFDLLAAKGMGAFVGKVNMDRHCPPYLQETTAVSLRETEELAAEYKGHPLVKPIITPRFAPTSTPALLRALGLLARRHDLPVQSHLAENKAEVDWVRELFPSEPSYAHVYHRFGLLGQSPTLMAHAIHLQEMELALIENSAVTLVHCPESNINLSSGAMPIRELLDRGIRLGLGSDIGAGHNPALYRVAARAIQLSKLYSLHEPQCKPLTAAEAFYLGTKGGGSFFGKVGSFEKGYAFDALVVEENPLITAGLSMEERLQKFLYTGEPGNICARFIRGKPIPTRYI